MGRPACPDNSRRGGYRPSHVWDGLLAQTTRDEGDTDRVTYGTACLPRQLETRGIQTESRMGRLACPDNSRRGDTDRVTYGTACLPRQLETRGIQTESRMGRHACPDNSRRGGYRLSHVWDGLLAQTTRDEGDTDRVTYGTACLPRQLETRGIQTESRMGRPACPDSSRRGGYRPSHVWDGLLAQTTRDEGDTDRVTYGTACLPRQLETRGIQTESRMGRLLAQTTGEQGEN